MKLSQLYPRKYASGADLAGKAHTLTIGRVGLEEMRPNPNAPATRKPVLYFAQTGKGVIMSRTLAYQIAGIIGTEETDAWPGHNITIYPEPMTVAGRAVIAIRARQPINGPGTAPEALQDPDEAV